jgi:membrane protein DedA with SNARE-associated domain
MFKGLMEWYLAKLSTGGYPLIVLLMAIESSIVPLPSELIIPPAAHLAYTHQASLGIVGIVLAGTLGSWFGASIMYWGSRLAGRPLVLRYGRLVFISPEKVQGAERWAAHYGSMGVFMSRLLPVVRHLIGIPAGIVRMDFRLYSLYTVLGSAVWCGVLCYVGIKMGQDEQLMKGQAHRLSIWIGGAMLVLGGMYYFFVYRQMKSSAKPGQQL